MSSYIRQIQTTLKQAGLYKGEIDGIAGRMTVDAVAQAVKTGIIAKDVQDDVKTINKTDPTVEGNTPAPATPSTAGKYSLGQASLDKLKGVNPELVKVVKRAIELSGIDFRVAEGLRTKETQARYVRQGKSQTMNSRHLTGHAVDLVAVVNGAVSWDFNHYYTIATAMAKAATELGVRVRWGGCWSVITGKDGTPAQWVASYKAERAKMGRKAFLDGVHFELPA